MKIDTLPDPLPGPPGSMWICPDTSRLMIWDGDGLIPLVALRKQDAERLAALVAELACPPLPTGAEPRHKKRPARQGSQAGTESREETAPPVERPRLSPAGWAGDL